MKTWWKRIVVGLLVIAVVALAIRYHRQVLDFLGDEAQVEAWIERLGPWGPLGLIVLNALQVVVPIIPGYVTQVAAGFLFGFPKGAFYGVIGMALGGLIAICLARALGRPLVVRIIGEARLAHWERVAHLNSLAVWFVLMLGVFGDIPYFIAGLSSVAVWKIIAIAALVRTPTVFLSAAVGAGVVDYRNPFIIAGAVLVVIAALLVMRYQAPIERWVDRAVLPTALKLATRLPGSAATAPAPPVIPETQDYDAASS